MSEIKVLYVEDSDFDAFYYKSKIEQSELSKFSVDVVVDLAKAKSAMSEMLRYDLILLDLNLPDSEGLGTLDAVMKTGTKLPVVVLSGTGDKAMFEEARKMGASGFMLKKADDYDVSEHIMAVVKKKRELAQRVSIQKTLGSQSTNCDD